LVECQDELNAKLLNIDGLNDRIDEQSGKFEELLGDRKSELDRVSHELKQKESEFNVLEENIDDMINQKTELARAISRLDAEIVDREEAHKRNLHELRTAIDETNMKLENQRSRLDKEKHRANADLHKVGKIEQNMKILEQKKRQMEKEIHLLENERDEIEASVYELEEKENSIHVLLALSGQPVDTKIKDKITRMTKSLSQLKNLQRDHQILKHNYSTLKRLHSSKQTTPATKITSDMNRGFILDSAKSVTGIDRAATSRDSLSTNNFPIYDSVENPKAGGGHSPMRSLRVSPFKVAQECESDRSGRLRVAELKQQLKLNLPESLKSLEAEERRFGDQKAHSFDINLQRHDDDDEESFSPGFKQEDGEEGLSIQHDIEALKKGLARFADQLAADHADDSGNEDDLFASTGFGTESARRRGM